MKATKYTVTIKLEMLSLDCVTGMLSKVITEIDQNEKVEGLLVADDGDRVEWDVVREPVNF